jgi:hypothetical protein
MKALIKRSILVVALVAACWVQSGAQRSGNTTLVVRVTPEAHLMPSQVGLRFRTSPGGVGDITSQTATISAWVRAVPGQHIRLTASLAQLSDATGAVFSQAVRWNGTPIQATGGGQTAICTNGTLQSGSTQDLIAGWQRSGTLSCAVSFGLSDPQGLPAGSYTGRVDLNLRSE